MANQLNWEATCAELLFSTKFIMKIVHFSPIDNGDEGDIKITMDDMQKNSASSAASTGRNKTVTSTPGELDEAFTISVYIRRIN